jgi:hypothetical protein
MVCFSAKAVCGKFFSSLPSVNCWVKVLAKLREVDSQKLDELKEADLP